MATPRLKARSSAAGLTLPPIVSHRLANGFSISAVQRGKIPLVALSLVAPCGSAQDPSDRFGLADLCARLLRRGTQSHSADQLDDALELVGASLSVGTSEDFFVARMTVPSEHLEPMIDLLAEVVRTPAFAADEVESAKQRDLARLSNDLDDPALVADRAVVRAVWGEHPYGHDSGGTTQHIRALSPQDVAGFYRDHMGPALCSMVAVGHLDVERLMARLEQAFGGWSGGPQIAPTVDAPGGLAARGKVTLIDKASQTQTQIRLGGLAIARNHPSFTAAHVANTALGGGFTSRLMQQIRVSRGLSYGVHSVLDAMKASGWFGISTFTKTESTLEAVQVALAEAKKMRERGLTLKELTQTQTYLAGLYPLRTESNEALAASLTDVQLFGLGKEWIENFRDRIFGVTLAQAKEAAAKCFLGDGHTLVLVGDAAQLEKDAAKLGEVRRWELSTIG